MLYAPVFSLRVPKRFALAGDVTAALSANVNDWNPAGLDSASILRINCTAASNITGIDPGAGKDGRVLLVENVGSDTATLRELDGASSADKQLSLGGAHVPLAPGYGALLVYDLTATKWRLPVGSEYLANKDAPNGYAGLDTRAMVPVIHDRPREWDRARGLLQKVPLSVELAQSGLRTMPTLAGATTDDDDANGMFLGMQTDPVSGDWAGVLFGQFLETQSRRKPELTVTVRTPTSLTNARMWIGFADAALYATATPDSRAIAAFRYENGTDTGWTTYSCDGTSTTEVNSNAVSIAADTVYELRVVLDQPGSKIEFWVNGTKTATNHTTRIPPATSALGWFVVITAKTAAAQKIRFSRGLLETAA